MKKIALLLTLFLAAYTAKADGDFNINTGAGGIVYIKQNGTGNGSSWTDAYPELADALLAAKTNTDIKEIWVAAGTYKPLHNANGTYPASIYRAFVLVEGLKIYGGFPADANDIAHTSIATRGSNPLLNATILNGDNIYHVVIGVDIAPDGETILDGLTISGGSAYGIVPPGRRTYIVINGKNIYSDNGGGIYNDSSSPTLTNVIISGNTAYNRGGGIYNDSSSPTLTNVTISGNTVVLDGGGIYNSSSSPTLTNLTISGNTAGYGGGIYNNFSSPTLTNVTISGNTVHNGGGGMENNWSSSPTLTNVTISGNTTRDGGGMENDNSSSPTLTNVTISGNTATGYGGGIYNDHSSSPKLTNVTISENTATAGGGIYNSMSSPTLTNLIISGNTAGGNGGGIHNIGASASALTNVTISGNTAGGNGGGIHNIGTYAPTLTNVTISGNTASGYGGGIYNQIILSPKLTNSIVWGNSAPNGSNVDTDSYHSPPTYNYSLVQGEDLTGTGTGNFNGTLPANNPLFVDWIDPSGDNWTATTTGNYRLLPTSPLIDKGNNELYESTSGRVLQSDVDLDGKPRFSGASIDLGAYEFFKPTWTGIAGNNWTEPGSWNSGEVPDATSSVYIPGNLYTYPVLTAETAVKDICFGPGAEIGRQDLLNYEKAFVQLDFSAPASRNRWYMLANPLRELYAGDFSFGGYPGMDMKLFKTENGKAVWKRITGLEHSFSVGDGFIVWLAPNREENKGLISSNGILELPYFDNPNVPAAVHWTHTYNDVAKESTIKVWKEENGYIVENEDIPETVVLRNNEAYRLAGREVNKTLTFGEDYFAIAGNPYMSSIDFIALYNANNTLIKGSYQIWIGPGGGLGGSYTGYNVAGNAPFGRNNVAVDMSRYIAPMQSFIVEKKIDASASETLTFDLSVIGLTFGNRPGLRSADPQGDKLDIVASTAQAGVRTVIVSRQEGGNGFGSIDSRKLFDEINSIPEVYTLKPRTNNEPIATAVNVLGEVTGETLIPLAIATTYKGELTFSFSGMDTYDARIFLLDTETNTEIELTDKAQYEYRFNYVPEQSAEKIVANESRFFIRLNKVSTGIETIAAEAVRIYAPRPGTLQVVSTHPLHQVLVYNLQGAKVYDAQVRSNTHKVEGLVGGVYIVKVVSGNTVTTEKVIVRN